MCTQEKYICFSYINFPFSSFARKIRKKPFVNFSAIYGKWETFYFVILRFLSIIFGKKRNLFRIFPYRDFADFFPARVLSQQDFPEKIGIFL